ncbi:hypothetical protein CYMTET_42106 [Cymbomonas tetramitiformis]|uniref:Response regulatory domain-containing protein n=1 Tax=Cymbomonas tetramitiformis TaxID=36881 RepID=A0AAE0C4U2_9CHLO|nr:hypothetical protein CYMTET_42106 [Cymbomonas tetramitiformis]
MRWQGLCDKLHYALDLASRLSFLGRHVEERDDSEDEQNRLKFLELIHCNIPGAVFHLSIPRSENLSSARCIYCSVGSLQTFGIASSRLTSAGSNFVKVFTSIIDPQYKQDFLDRFADLEKSATGLEWKGKLLLPSASSALETPRWICVLIQPRAQTQSNAASGELQYVTATASSPWLDFVGCAWDCSAEQEAEELCIEKEMHQSDLHFFHFAQHSLAELLVLVDLVQQELPVLHKDLLSGRPEDHDDGLPDGDGQLLKSLLGELKRVCQRGKQDCLMRPLLNLISDGGYQQAPQIVTGEQIVAFFAGECNIVAAPPSTELANAHIQIDLKVMYIVLSNLVSNALKYGSQEEKPQVSIKPLTSTDLVGGACQSVVLELWNAPGANHMDFLENSKGILQPNCLPAHGLLSDGIGMATIQMCLKCTEWTMQHKVDLNGTTFQVCMPGAVVLDVDVGPMPACTDHNIQSGRNEDEGGWNIGQRSEQDDCAPEGDISARPLQTWPSKEPHGKLPPGVRVAVLDDAGMMRMVYKQQLRKMQVSSFWVQGECEAEIFGFAKLVMENNVDIVVLDQNLSEVLGFKVGKYVDGCSIMHDLMSMGFNGVCVTRTAYHSSECKSKYLGHGFDDVFSKIDSFEKQLNTSWKHIRELLLWRRTPALVGFRQMRFVQRAQVERFPAHSTSKLGSSPGKTKLDLPRQHSWESAYWEQTSSLARDQRQHSSRRDASTLSGEELIGLMCCLASAMACTVLSYRTERQRRLNFLAQQSSKQSAQLDGTSLGDTNADKLIQSPLLLYFLSRPLELRFCAHKHAQCLSSRRVGWRLGMIALLLLLAHIASSMAGLIDGSAFSSGGVITLAVLHAAASAASLARHQHYADEGVPAKHLETCWLLVMWLSQCTLVLCHGLDLQAPPAASAAVPLAMVALHWIHISADICQRQPWYQIAACGLVPLVVHGVWGVASFTVLNADWAASTEAATAAPAQHRNDAAFQLWTFSYVIAVGKTMAHSTNAYFNEKIARQDFLGVEEQRAAEDRAAQQEVVDATVTSDEGGIANRKELHGWQLHLPRHSWESAYWEQTAQRGEELIGLMCCLASAMACTVLSYRTERQRRLNFLAQQSSKQSAQLDGTSLGDTNADKLIQSPLLLYFLSRPLELRFCAHKHAQCLSSRRVEWRLGMIALLLLLAHIASSMAGLIDGSAFSSGGVITLAVLHAAASAASLARHQHYADEGVPAKHLETCWLLVMWLSQCTLVLCHGLDLQAPPAASAAVPLAMVALHWIHISADICQRQPWYQIAACGLVPLVVHGVWGVASFTVLNADWAASTEAATAAPAQHRNDAAFQLWTFSYVIAVGKTMAHSTNAYFNEKIARQDFLGVEEQRAAEDRAAQQEAPPAASAAVPLAMVALHWIHISADICQRQPWYQIAACGLVPLVVHGVWGVASFTVLNADWAASTEAATAAPAQHRNDAAFQLWTFSYVIAAGTTMARSMDTYFNEKIARQDFLGVEEQRAAEDRAAQQEVVDATVTSDEGGIANRKELHGGPGVGAMLSWTCKAVWGMLGTLALWYAGYQSSLARDQRQHSSRRDASTLSGEELIGLMCCLASAMACTVLSYRTERQRRLNFLAQQSSKQSAQLDGTSLGDTNADKLIQSPLLLYFLSRPLELRFCAHKHAQCLSSRRVGWRLGMIALLLLLAHIASSMAGLIDGSAFSSGGVITLAVLHAAASAASLARHQHYADEGVPAKHLETCWLLVMWLSQCTLVLCHGLDLQAPPAASAAVPLAMVALHWIHISADICQRQPWYQIAACGLVPLVVHGVWGVASFTVLNADWAASTEAATAAPAQHRNDAAFQLWTFSYVIAVGKTMAHSTNAYFNEKIARQDFLGVEEQRAAEDRAAQQEVVDATVTSDEGGIANRKELHGWQLHLPRHSWESAYWEQTAQRGFHQTVAAAAAGALPVNWVGIIKPKPELELKWVNLTASCVSVDLASKRSRKIVKYTGMFTDYTARKHLGHLQKQRTIRLSDNHLFHAVKNSFVGAYHCAEQIRKSIQKSASSLPHHSLDPMIKHAHSLTLIALRGQSDCHCRAMLNNVFEGLYVSKMSSVRFAAVLEDIAVSKLGSLLECHVAGDAKVVTLIDLRMCTAMLVCLLTHILTEASCDSVTVKPVVYLNIVGTDVRVDIKHSVKRPLSKSGSLPLTQSTLLQDADNIMPNLQNLTPLQPSPAIAAIDANQMSALAVKERSRIDVCRQCIVHLGWELNVGVITSSNMDDIMCYSVIMPEVVHLEPCIIPENSKDAEQSSPPTQSGVLLQSWVKIAALDDCPISRLLLKRSLVVKLQAQEVWVSGKTYEEILNFPKLVMESGIHIVILDQCLSQALPPKVSETVTGNSVMKDLRRMGFKGMIILRSGDVQKDDDKEETFVRAGFNAIIGKDGDCAETICTKWHHWCNSTKVI